MGVNRIIGTPDEAWSFSLFVAAMTRVMTIMRSDISLSVIEKWRLVISVWLLFPQYVPLLHVKYKCTKVLKYFELSQETESGGGEM